MSVGTPPGAPATSAPVAPGARPLDPAPGALLVDARFLGASGIGRYLRELLAHWLAEPPFGSLVLLGDGGALRAFVAERGAAVPVRVVPHRGGPYSPASQLSWLAAGRREARAAAAAFFPHWDAPVVAMPAASVVTVHDLIPFRVPDAFPASRRIVGAPVLRRVVRAAGRVVCVSEATALDLCRAVPAAAAKTHVVPNGVSARFAAPPASRPPIEGPYLLAVGNVKPHKNLAAALDVLARLRALGHDRLRLVVAGRQFGDDELARAAAARGLAGAVVTVGEVSDDALHALYAGAEALLFPSRYEGFGLPVLEAMAAGVPVVASDTPAVAETVGDAAPTFDPADTAGMAAAVDALIRWPGARAEAIARGRARAAAYSWAAAARATGRHLQAVASANIPR